MEPIEGMDEKHFWDLIESSIKTVDGENETSLNTITRKLAKLEPDEIIGFEITFRQKIIEADHYNAMIPLKIINGYVSDDTYLYYRCWLISLGEDVFYNTIKNPDFLAPYVKKEIYPEFESLLYISTHAYSIKTGIEEENESFPRSIAFEAGLDYNFYAPPTKGQDWTEDELPEKAPILWNIFN